MQVLWHHGGGIDSTMKTKPKWHARQENDVYTALASSKEGLDSQEAAKRLQIHGPNTLPTGKPPRIWEILVRQIKSPIISILLVAATAALVIGETTDAIFIFIVIGINTALGTYQEYNAEKSAISLQSLIKIRARVRRDNIEFEIPSEELVPGDIVLLESGYKVPADLRLLETDHNLTADESFLTGESIPATKRPGVLPDQTGVSERENIAFAGSTIMAGRGLGIVIATGMKTEVGQIAEHIHKSESAKPPLLARMDKFTNQIGLLVILLVIALSTILYLQGNDMSAVFFIVVALAVSAIPEGLPVALTIALSIAVSRMSKRNVIVRKLTAVESLGSCTVIASDKTGTLTVNQQTARQVVLADGQMFNISGQGYNGEGEFTPVDQTVIPEPAMEQLKNLSILSVLANEGSLVRENEKWVHYGDAIDVAFLGMAYKLGIDPRRLKSKNKILGMIPYESVRKFSATFYQKDDMTYVAAKGATETILGLCNRMQYGNKVVVVDRKLIEKQSEEMATRGYRVLAVAGVQWPGFEKKDVYDDESLPEMIFYGLVGFIDPLRPEVIHSVNECKEAGIKVIMITGDHPSTAQALAKELGIARFNESVVTGQQLSAIEAPDSPEFAALVSSTHVFARVSPTQKLEIVDSLINQGEFVAVTGDGVNDAPALHRANIGVAMGSGTDVAKEVSDMIITDDNFTSIVSGVEEGRFAYDNVRKVVYLLISTAAAEVFMFFAAILAGLPLPLIAVQILWLNLVTNGIQDVALAYEAGEPGAMKRKPRKTNEKIFNLQMVNQTLISGLTIGMIAFGFWYVLIEMRAVEETYARNSVLLLMVLMQNIHVFNCRSETVSAFKIPISRNYLLVLGVLAAQGIHILSMHLPLMQNVLRIEPITMLEWFEILLLALPLLLIMELYKWIKTVRPGSQNGHEL